MRSCAVLFAVGLAMQLHGSARAETPEAARRATVARTAAAEANEERSLLRQLADAQKWVGEQIWATKEAVDALPGTIAEVKDQMAANEDEVRKLRDEVKGLYVEVASLREQLDEVRAEVGGVNSNISSFRTWAGFFIAVMVLLLVAVTVMTMIRR